MTPGSSVKPKGNRTHTNQIRPTSLHGRETSFKLQVSCMQDRDVSQLPRKQTASQNILSKANKPKIHTIKICLQICVWAPLSHEKCSSFFWVSASQVCQSHASCIFVHTPSSCCLVPILSRWHHCVILITLASAPYRLYTEENFESGQWERICLLSNVVCNMICAQRDSAFRVLTTATVVQKRVKSHPGHQWFMCFRNSIREQSSSHSFKVSIINNTHRPHQAPTIKHFYHNVRRFSALSLWPMWAFQTKNIKIKIIKRQPIKGHQVQAAEKSICRKEDPHFSNILLSPKQARSWMMWFCTRLIKSCASQAAEVTEASP